MVIKDLCAAYRGEIYIVKEPSELEPIEETKLVKILLTTELRDYITG